MKDIELIFAVVAIAVIVILGLIEMVALKFAGG